MDNHLVIGVRDAGGVAVFDFSGDFTEKAERDFDAVVRPRLTDGCRIVMNFTAVNYINSSGIALLISFITALQAAGGRLVIFGLTPHFQKIFEIVGLTQYLEIRQDETSALNEFSR